MNRLLSIICTLFIVTQLSGQVSAVRDKTISLPEDDIGWFTTAIARDYITLNPGYEINGEAGIEKELKIDESLVFSADYRPEGDYANPLTRKIDKSKPVGSMAGSGSVTPTGGAAYQVPLILPPGTAGMQPNVSVVYNSQGGGGFLGKGWDIGGLSAITRTPQDHFHDGYAGGIYFDDNDRFALDGQRLVLYSGKYGGDGSEYRTESETFMRIKLHGNAELQYFTVETKDGRTLEYGRAPEARVTLQGKGRVFTWQLNKVTDANGNYMVYEYEQEEGEIRIEKIKYTGNTDTGLAPYNTVQFYYDLRSDKRALYIGGAAIKRKHVLRQIKTFSDGALLKYYTFGYADSKLTKLHEITEHAASGQQLNATVLGWQNLKTTFDDELTTVPNPCGSKNLFGDFNGDGKKDLLVQKRRYPAQGDYSTDDKWQVYLGTGSKTFQLVWEGSLKKRFKGFLIGDFDGDGDDDILMRSWNQHSEKVQVNCNDETAQTTGVKKTENKITKTGRASSVAPPPEDDICYQYFSWWQNDFEFFHFEGNAMIRNAKHDWNFRGEEGDIVYNIDLDANGDMEYLILKSDKTYRTVAGLTTQYFEYFKSPDILRFIDFNGNGKVDIMVIKGDNTKIFEYDGSKLNTLLNSNSLFNKDWLIYWTGHFPEDRREKFFAGDFNGDRMTDFLSYDEDKKWYRYMSTGRGFSKELHTGLTGNLSKDNQITYAYRVEDMNGDGISDILEVKTIWKNNVSSSKDFYLYKNRNLSFEKEVHTIETTDDLSFAHFFDINGDGINELILKQYWAHPFSIISFDIDEPQFVKNISNGNGLRTTFNYRSQPFRGINYNSDREIATDFSNYTVNMHVVNYMEHWSPTQRLSRQEYTFTDANINRMGKGFMGFSEVKVKDYYTSIETTSTYTYKNSESGKTFYFPALTGSTKKYGSTTLESTVVGYHVDNLSTPEGTRYFAYPKTKTTTTPLTGTTVAQSFAYDGYGNLETSTTNYGNDGSETVTNIYIKQGAWCKSRLQKSTTTRKYKSEPEYSVTADNTFDSKGNLKTSTSKGVTNTYGIDGYGNVTSTTATGADIVATTSSVVYDPKGRFVEEAKNSQGQTAYYTYDLMGRKLTHQGIDGNTSRFEYDEFGKMVKSVSADGIETRHTFGWSGPDKNGALYYIYSQASGMPYRYTYYDILGRVVREESDSYNGMVVVDKKYNQKGQLYEETFPYLYSQGAASVPKTTYGYDNYGRPKSVTSNGLTTSTLYNGKEVSTTLPSGDKQTKTYDDMGMLTTASDEGGSISYYYYSHGQPREIRAPGSKFTMTYDTNGFQKTLSDPDAGNFTYDYNSAGQLMGQTSPKGDKTSFTYDDLGRVKTKTTPDGTYTYAYIASGNGTGQLDKILKGGTELEDYDYDSFGRLTNFKEKTGDIYLATGYAYNANGQLSAINYPEGFGVKYAYDNIGALTEIRDASDNRVIWSLDDINNDGQLGGYSYGNGLSTSLTYDAHQLPDKITTGGIQQLDYNFNAEKGWLDNRTGMVKGIKETFEYDGLNQLTGVTSSMPALNQSVQYDGKVVGNIASKSDVGTYHYGNGAGPHALTAVTSPSQGLINKASQDIDYTWFEKVGKISEGDHVIDFTYGFSQQRAAMEVKHRGSVTRKVYYSGNYERHVEGGTTRHIYYINSPGGLAAICKKEAGSSEMYYVHTDHLGSVHAITGEGQNVKARYYYDAWGRQKELDINGTAFSTTENLPWLHRGYTGHEHIKEVGIINMNGRVYDPVLGRFMSPDPYVQAPDMTVNFNRYAYCLNNPLIYTDPSGESFLSKLASGLSFGLYGLWQHNKAQQMGYNDVQSFLYAGAQTAITATSTWAGSAISTSGVPFANTLSVMASSAISSTGTSIITGGRTDISVSFGVASYNFTQGEWGYLGKKGNSALENIGYGLGAFANLSDAWAIAKGAYGNNVGEADLVTKNDPIGHSELRTVPDAKGNTENLISVGPDWDRAVRGDSFWDAPGYNDWPTHANDVGLDGLTVSKIRISNVRLDKINQYVSGNLKNFRYSALNTNCVTSVSNALLKAGVLNMPFLRHPSLLQMQMFARRYSYFSPYMTNP